MSIFNDDKKTELIGENWVALESIIVPGGGQHDSWQTLNCKGRYAGEIRIELTYYDTRPRENLPDPQRSSLTIEQSADDGRGKLAGPRQPKPVKRRPLPSEPVQNQSTGPEQTLQDFDHGLGHPSAAPQVDYDYQPQSSDSGFRNSLSAEAQHPAADAYGISSNSQNYWRLPYQPEDDDQIQPPYQETESDVYTTQQQSTLSQSPVADRNFGYRAEPRLSNHSEARSVERPYDVSDQDDAAYSNIDPRLYGQPARRGTSQSASSQSFPQDENQYMVSPLSKNGSYDNSLAHRGPHRNTGDQYSSPLVSPIDDENAPPPPPVHGSTPQQTSPFSQPSRTSEGYRPIPPTAPLNVRRERSSVSGSPLSQVQSMDARGHAYAPPLSLPQSYPYATPSNASMTLAERTDRSRREHSPIWDHTASMPPSLVPGFEANVISQEFERTLQGPPSQHSRQPQMRPDNNGAQHENSMPEAHSLPNAFASGSERRSDGYSVPIVRPRPISPQRTAMRKPVSPRPEHPSEERRQSSGIPFSPDSYDAFNPSLSQSSSINEAGPQYNTPEQAKEAAWQAERKTNLGDGPIIGSNGRVIDPSDHLPTDTWAPEPELKTPRKKPEVTLRFRHSPQGAQPMPTAGSAGGSSGGRRPLAETRPNAVPIRSYQQYSSADSSPASAHRIRLQKKAGVLPSQHPVSSPAVPTMKTNNSPRDAVSRSAASEYPYHTSSNAENYAYGSSPTYYRGRSPDRGAIPPPVPGKIPIGGDFGDQGMSALSEEMRNIDIGMRSGARPRRGRFGP